MLEVRHRFEDLQDLTLTEHDGELLLALGVRDMADRPIPVEGGHEEETQGAHGLVEYRPRALHLVDEVDLVGADLLRVRAGITPD